MLHRNQSQEGATFGGNLSQNGDDKDEGVTALSSDTSTPKDDQGSSTNGSDVHSRAGSSRTGTTMEDETNIITEELARVETKHVLRLRIVVILILVSVAIAMSVTIYYVTRKAEIEAFEIEYVGVADSIISSLNSTYKGPKIVRWTIDMMNLTGSRIFLHSDMVNQMSAVAGFAVTISTEADAWPFVTLNNFQKRAKNVQFLSRCIYLTMNPIVQSADLAAWESYVTSPANSWM